MTQSVAGWPRWSKGRWGWMILLVFASQLLLILWLGRAQRPPRVRNDLVPELGLLAPDAAQALAVNDPTLFALPHLVGFSGQAWLTVPQQSLPIPEWSDTPQWLTLVQDKLGANFKEYAFTNPVLQMPLLAQPQLQLKQPALVSDPEAFPTQSVLRLTGELSRRRLLAPLALTNWPGTEILSNTVVQILVGADGRLVSAPTLLKPRGGPNEADLYALREVRKARFEPISVADPLNPQAGLTVGQLIFEWHTVPPAPTNATPEKAAPK